MAEFRTLADVRAIEAEMPYAARKLPATMHAFLSETAARFPDRPAISFQMFSGAGDPAETWNWAEFLAHATQAANLFRKLGVGPGDTVAFALPNCMETASVFLGGSMAGVVAAINPLLEPEHIAAILRETNAKVVVTLKPFPKTDIAQKIAKALEKAPSVTHLLEVDLLRYITGLKRWIIPFLRPGNPAGHGARVLDFHAETMAMGGDALDFPDPPVDRIAACFHTGGTTGVPKVVRHKVSGIVYNGWLGRTLLFREQDTILCPLPLFHVFAAYPILMSSIASGAHLVLPTPAGYRGEGVMDNIWKLIERWNVSFLVAVPTAISALMQRPVNADISTLRSAFSGSAPLPVEIFRRFRAATGVEVLEGYGLTEATCLVSVNPPEGVKKTGSVGLPFPYTDVKILLPDGSGGAGECAGGEVGEICISAPGVFVGHTYTDPAKNRDLYWGQYLRTGDLGRIDEDGYLFITGRSKDLIIRGGHNIDPALIEEALMDHPAVAFAGAIGQPDSHAGELPSAYVELVEGAQVSIEELITHATAHIPERAAHPKYLEILPELPKTAVGKVRKPDLRKLAIRRVLDAALAEAHLKSRVADVVEDGRRGLTVHITSAGDPEAAVRQCLGNFAISWDWQN